IPIWSQPLAVMTLEPLRAQECVDEIGGQRHGQRAAEQVVEIHGVSYRWSQARAYLHVMAKKAAATAMKMRSVMAAGEGCRAPRTRRRVDCWRIARAPPLHSPGRGARAACKVQAARRGETCADSCKYTCYRWRASPSSSSTTKRTSGTPCGS